MKLSESSIALLTMRKKNLPSTHVLIVTVLVFGSKGFYFLWNKVNTRSDVSIISQSAGNATAEILYRIYLGN